LEKLVRKYKRFQMEFEFIRNRKLRFFYMLLMNKFKFFLNRMTKSLIKKKSLQQQSTQ
jgi:hypothetical protein